MKALEKSVYTTIGGIVSPEESDIHSFEDFKNMLSIEIHEEIGVTQDHITDSVFLGSVYSTMADVGFIFSTSIDLTSDEVADLFRQRCDDEIAQINFIEATQVKKHLASMEDYWALIPELMVGKN